MSQLMQQHVYGKSKVEKEIVRVENTVCNESNK